MSRLDPRKKGSEVSLTPTPEEISSGREEIEDTEEVEAEDPGTIQSAASYGDRVKQRQAAMRSVKRSRKPLGGAPEVEPGKLAELTGLNQLMATPNFGEDDLEEPPPDPYASRAPENPVDPEEEKQLPSIGGVGSAYVANQRMARGHTKGPVTLGEAKRMGTVQQDDKPKERPKQLSPESMEALKKVQVEDTPAFEEPKSPLDDTDAKKDMEEAEDELATSDFPGFNFDALTRQQQVIANDERRKIIESRLEPLNIGDMIIQSEIKQTIPVIPDKLVYTLRTFNQQEYLFCLQYVYDQVGSAAYVEELLNTCKLACALFALNGKALPDHRKEIGTPKEEVDRDAFRNKLAILSRMPTNLLADISVQAIWFQERVQKLFSIENLKNG